MLAVQAQTNLDAQLALVGSCRPHILHHQPGTGARLAVDAQLQPIGVSGGLQTCIMQVDGCTIVITTPTLCVHGTSRQTACAERWNQETCNFGSFASMQP